MNRFCSVIQFAVFILPALSFAQFKNIKVSGIPTTYYPNEVTIAINPVNPLQLAAGANINYFYSSEDGGKTWHQQTLSSSFGVWGDPVVTYDAAGNLYFGHLSNPASGGYFIDRIVVQRSSDNGKSWDNGKGIGYSPPRKQQDKEWLTTDLTNSPFRNNVYMAWTEFDSYGSKNVEDSTRILFSCSSDFGETWRHPIVVSDRGGNCLDSDLTVEGAVPAVGPNGEVYLSWAGPQGIMFDKSLDGGKSFGKDIFVTDQPNGWDFGAGNLSGISRCNGFPVTACDISNSPYRGNIYILWGDQRNGLTNADVFLVKSTDGGNSWSSAVRVNNDNTARHQFFPWLAIDRATGFIHVVFYDRRNTIGNETEVYLARSTDGGSTFTNFKISETPFVPKSDFIGDYINIAAHNGKIYPIWTRADNKLLSVWAAIIDDNELATGLPDKQDIFPASFQLLQNYPNPLNPGTTISYILPETSEPRIKIFDLLGRIVFEKEEGVKGPGIYEFYFNAAGLTSGIYIYTIETAKFSAAKKMIVLK